MRHLLRILLLALLASCTAEHGDLPSEALYRRYASRPDLTAAQVGGLRVGDTVRVDVLILVADDSEGWQRLKAEYDIRTSEGVTSWLGDINRPQRRVKRGSFPAWRAMAVHDERTLALYRVDNAAQLEALRNYQIDNMQ